MKKKILAILGNNHLDPISFNSANIENEVYGLYTFENNVFVLKEGMDLEFDELSKKEKEKVLTMVESNNWKVDKTLQ